MSRYGVLVVGGSLAGMTLAGALRQGDYDGPVTILDAEPGPAYARPPLSKGMLTGSDTVESIRLSAPPAEVTVRTGVAATGLDVAARRVRLDTGESLGYDTLVIATGSRARTLREVAVGERLAPGGDSAERENVLRTRDDALRLRDRLDAARSVLVVGGGFLGMEIASSAHALGKSVTVVDLRTPLLSTMGPFLAELFTEAARAHGVRVVVAPGGVRLARDGGRITGVDTTEVGRLAADLVVTAVGDEPAVDWLCSSGLALRGGVVVDGHCRAAAHVHAIGDVAVFPTARGPARMPHWDTAIGQARAAAESILRGDAAAPYRPEPYFWTEAFGLAAKLAGHLPVTGDPDVVRGSLTDPAALLHWPDPRWPAAAAINYRLPVARLRRLASA